ncbi:ATP-dependent RNA helicase DDX24 [Aphelenchoides fujianensis]|nr:ATP-dependent RNA helicase DDX24 [Aphelenchoides fujianensis]
MSEWLELGISEPIRGALDQMGKKKAKRRRVSAVVLAPTRELVLQIHAEFKRIAQFTPFRSVAIIGGLSEEKQERLLGKRPHVIIATPGRFWALVQRNDYASDFTRLRHVIIDEIDRMVEKGHFREVENILEAIHSNKLPKLQTLVFSATLTFIVLPNANQAQKSREEKLREISKATRMRKNYRLVDLTNEFATPNTLVERRMCCSNLLQKDTRLYFTLLTFKGRTLVFTNSIDAAQRLHGLLMKLQFQPTPLILHAKMHEKKRLKNLERFAPDDLPTLELDNSRRMAALEKRVHLASELERLEYQLRKVTNRKSWEVRMAEAADIVLSDEGESDGESELSNKKRLKKSAERGLKAALSQPLPTSSFGAEAAALKRAVI